jgi:hypothetical protein
MNPTRDQQVQALRPVLEALPVPDEALGAFQTKVLRPLLKFQHAYLLQVFKHYLAKKKVAWEALNAKEQRDYVENSLKKDAALKYLLIGSICGLMNEEEMAFFLAQQDEISKRLLAFMAKRIAEALGQGHV